MTVNLEHFGEPKLQFGAHFEHSDAKTGLSEYGPFGKNFSGLHVSEVKLGFVGTRESISMAEDWIDRCSGFIESENLKTTRRRVSSSGPDLFGDQSDADAKVAERLDKIQNRDFIGFNDDTAFESSFQTNRRWRREINQRRLDEALREGDDVKRILNVADLVEEEIESISRTDPIPSLIVVALPEGVADAAGSAKVAEGFHLNLRRVLKARAMRQQSPIPIQITLPRTVHGGDGAQGPATRAWNFCTALYYKAGGVPWRPTDLEENTCYMGIDFYLAQGHLDADDEEVEMRSSVSMAFDYLGQGLVLRGEKFSWNPKQQGRAPHMTTERAKELIARTLEEYAQVMGSPPRRLVVHKSSRFWGEEHEDYDEISGVYEGVDSVFSDCKVDLVALRQTQTKLFREGGQYPPLRGTYFEIEGEHFLYTMGFTPHLETYPKPYVPKPWQISQHIGGSAPKDLLREVLALTKMNVNNCSFADGKPITTSFSGKIGDVMKHVGGGPAQPRYRFYM